MQQKSIFDYFPTPKHFSEGSYVFTAPKTAILLKKNRNWDFFDFWTYQHVLIDLKFHWFWSKIPTFFRLLDLARTRKVEKSRKMSKMKPFNARSNLKKVWANFFFSCDFSSPKLFFSPFFDPPKWSVFSMLFGWSKFQKHVWRLVCQEIEKISIFGFLFF